MRPLLDHRYMWTALGDGCTASLTAVSHSNTNKKALNWLEWTTTLEFVPEQLSAARRLLRWPPCAVLIRKPAASADWCNSVLVEQWHGL
jgi:hypothetical protein